MATTKQRRRVRCGGCTRRMYENAPANRDYGGRSWHYECLANATGSARHYAHNYGAGGDYGNV